MNLYTIFLLLSSFFSFNANLAGGILMESQAQVDLITDLPGLNQELVQYSGYLPLANTEKKIHYWFIQSESNPESDPVVFWTNGGPGCSGLLGLLTEQGPFKPNANGQLEPNEWRWNRIANMIFVEQPVGVGYSYSTNSSDYRIGDDQAAKDNLQLVLAWLEKFPQYKSNPLFITSESYGGHYMPTWAKEIVEYNKKQPSESKINFKGFAVGNPYLDYYSGSGAEMEALYARQMLPKPSWDKYVDQGCTKPDTMLNNSICSTMMLDFMHITSNSNPYAIDYPTCVSAQSSWMSDFIYERSNVNSGLFGTKLNAHPAIPLKDDYEPCEDNYVNEYMNREDVQNALHVNKSIIWSECSNTVKYELKDKMKSVVHIYKELIDDKEADIRILIYSGDDDSVCATGYTQHIVFDILNYKIDSYWKLWKVDGQSSGYITQFNTHLINHLDNHLDNQSKLAFSTVHFAGHEVPAYKPKEAFVLFNAFINNDYILLNV